MSSLIAALLLSGCGGGNSNGNTTNSDNGSLSFDLSPSKSVIEGTTDITTLSNSGGEITFNVTGGDDADKFEIDPATGVLRFKMTPDFENPTDSNRDNIYIVTITATKGEQSVSKTVEISVTDDANDNGPEFTSADHTPPILENTPLDFTVNASGAVSYKIVGGDDKNLFAIDNNGKLSFLNFLPDYEHPSDKNRDNVYDIIIQATDGAGHSSLQNVSVTVQDDESEQTSSKRFVFKTGLSDGPAPTGQPFGDDRTFTDNTIGGDHIIKMGERTWEDSEHTTNTPVTYQDALNYCAQLSQSNYAGIDNWRVPIRHELYEIINYGKTPTIDDIFNHKNGGNYWTKQKLVNYHGESIDNTAFVISFSSAEVFPKDMGADALVRCVSGPEYVNPPVLQKDAEGIFKDNSTGLWWAKDAGNSTWQAAKTRCEDLNISGKTDWRLPNINELHAIMPVYNEEFLLDSDGNHPEYGDLRGPFWASTDAKDPTKARKIENYWGENWAIDQNHTDATHPYVGRDVLNDGIEPKEHPYEGSICIRGGHL